MRQEAAICIGHMLSFLDVERLGAGRLVVGVERDFLDLRLAFRSSCSQCALSASPRSYSSMDGFKLDIAVFELADDLLKLLQRLLEGEILDVGIFGRFGA